MHPATELGGERCVDHPVALQTALPPEWLRHDIQAEMTLPARPVAGMTFVLVGFIDHPNAFRSESFGQLSCDEVGNAHRFGLGGRISPVNGRSAVERGWIAPQRGRPMRTRRLAAGHVGFA